MCMDIIMAQGVDFVFTQGCTSYNAILNIQCQATLNLKKKSATVMLL